MDIKAFEALNARRDRAQELRENPTELGAWQVFGDEGMIWLCNRILRLFGWGLLPEATLEGELLSVTPKRIKGSRGPQEPGRLNKLMHVPGLLKEFLRDNLDKITEDLQ